MSGRSDLHCWGAEQLKGQHPVVLRWPEKTVRCGEDTDLKEPDGVADQLGELQSSEVLDGFESV